MRRDNDDSAVGLRGRVPPVFLVDLHQRSVGLLRPREVVLRLKERSEAVVKKTGYCLGQVCKSEDITSSL